MGRSIELAGAIRSFNATEQQMRCAQGWFAALEKLGELTPAFVKAERSKHLQNSEEGVSVALEQNE